MVRIFFDYWRDSLNQLRTGVVRRLLGLTFLGETREADEMIVGDVEIDGLTRDVSPQCLSAQRARIYFWIGIEFWHLWGSKESNQVYVQCATLI